MDISQRVNYLKSANNLQIAGGDQDFDDSITDYLTTGVVNSGVSAFVGIYNTFHAFGTMLGVAEESGRMDTYDTINSVFGENHAEFYERHAEGIDAFGLIIGSIVPGGAAVKGLRALQLAGKVAAPARAATAMKNSDIVLGSQAIETAKQAVLKAGTTHMNNPAVYRAYATGLKQNMIEAVVFEAAMLGTMNQHSTLNPDELSYLDALGTAAVDGLPFLLAGGVLGSAIDGLRIRGAIRNFSKEEYARTGKFAVLHTGDLEGITNGQKLLALAESVVLRKQLLGEIDEADEFAVKRFNDAHKALENLFRDTVTDLNEAGGAPIKYLEDLVFGAKNDNIMEIAENLMGVTAIKNISPEENKAMQTFFERSNVAPVISGTQGESIQQLGEYAKRLTGLMEDIGVEVTPEVRSWLENPKTLDALSNTVYAKQEGNYGVYSGGVKSDGTPLSVEELRGFQLRSAIDFLSGKSQDFSNMFRNTILVNESSITRYHSIISDGIKELNTVLGREAFKIPTIEDSIRFTTLHELSHAKNNMGDLFNKIRLYDPSTLSAGQKVSRDATIDYISDLINLSFEARPRNMVSELNYLLPNLGTNLASLKPQDRGKVFTELMQDIPYEDLSKTAQKLLGKDVDFVKARIQQGWINPSYMLQPAELFADAGAMLTNISTRQRASKIAPQLAKALDQSPGITKSWEETKSYLNLRTGESHTGQLFGIADMSKKTLVPKVSMRSGAMSIRSEATGVTYSSNPKKLFGSDIDALDEGLDYLAYDAEWTMWSNLSDKGFLAKTANRDKNQVLESYNLPAIERILSGKFDDLFNDGKVFLTLDGVETQVTKEFLESHLIKAKQKFWFDASVTGKFSEFELAKVLNVDINAATGELTPTNWITGKAFDQPEMVSLSHKKHSIQDIDFNVRSTLAAQTNAKLLDHQKQKLAAELLGNTYANMPELSLDQLAYISPLETRTTLLTNARTTFGSVRERMQFIGKQLADQEQRATHKVHKDFARFNQVFNQQASIKQRMELAMTENYARDRWYTLMSVETSEGMKRVMLAKDDLESLAANMGKPNSPTSAQDFLDFFYQHKPGEFVADGEFGDAVLGLVGKNPTPSGAPSAAILSEEVGELWAQHMRLNSSIVAKKQGIADVRGGTFTAHPHMIYPPPKDLTKEKYFGFITPKAFQQGADGRKYMVYGKTEQELQEKIAQINTKYGNDYEVISNPQSQDFKKYRGEYERGEVFDSMFFDAGMHRSGASSELIPNLDVGASGTLDRLVNWHVRQEHNLLKSGVELKYAEQVQTLREYDRVASTFTKGRADKRNAEIGSIANDSLDLMLNRRTGGGWLEDIYVRVNDYVGEKGSALIDEAFATLKGQRNLLNQGNLNEFNKTLEAQGFKPPFSDVFNTIVASPDPGVSRTLANSVRSLNNLAGALMLRMDWAHSVIQLISTPILMLPVLLEAKQALRGTQAGQVINDLTSVVNPANGMREPSAMKLMFNSMKNFFTPEGKEFMRQLRANNIVSDYLIQYGEIHDYSQLAGRHTLKAVNDKIDQLSAFGSKVSMFTVSEEFTRFMVADAVRQIGQARGLSGAELMSSISSAVDKVHGVYLTNQRPQLFKGTVGQAIGLYQTYFFNFVQNATKYVGDANHRQALTMGALQGSIFGLQSFPGFDSLNRWIGEANRDNTDIFSITDANNPKSVGAYAMFGLGSHVFGTPIDFYTRGDLAVRNATVVANPLNPMEIPAVDLAATIISNMVGIVKDVSARATGNPNVAPPMEAFLHGMAHNGMNRPLAGLASVMRNRVTSGYGQVYFQDSNYVDYDASQEFDWGKTFARVIGTKPLDESIIMNNYFRQKGYQANTRRELSELGETMQLTFASGQYDRDQVALFARQYEKRGGDLENFNAYFARQFQASSDGVMQSFQRDMIQEGELKRQRDRLMIRQSSKPVWEY